MNLYYVSLGLILVLFIVIIIFYKKLKKNNELIYKKMKTQNRINMLMGGTLGVLGIKSLLTEIDPDNTDDFNNLYARLDQLNSTVALNDAVNAEFDRLDAKILQNANNISTNTIHTHQS